MLNITNETTLDELIYIRDSMFPHLTLEELWSRREVNAMNFDSLAKEVTKLQSEQQSQMLFYLLGNLNGYYKYDFDNDKTLNKQQALTLVNDSLQAVM